MKKTYFAPAMDIELVQAEDMLITSPTPDINSDKPADEGIDASVKQIQIMEEETAEIWGNLW